MAVDELHYIQISLRAEGSQEVARDTMIVILYTEDQNTDPAKLAADVSTTMNNDRSHNGLLAEEREVPLFVIGGVGQLHAVVRTRAAGGGVARRRAGGALRSAAAQLRRVGRVGQMLEVLGGLGLQVVLQSAGGLVAQCPARA